MQNIFGILEAYSLTLYKSHLWALKFYLSLLQNTVSTLESEINDPGTFINSSSFSHGYDLISEGTFINSNDFSIHDWKDKETRKFGKHVFYSFQ